MSTCSLTDRVRNYLCTKYNKIYKGTLTYQVIPTDGMPTYYNLAWGLNQETYPFIMQGEFSDEDAFYNYVVQQIGITKFYDTKHFIARRIGQPEFLVPDYKDPLLTFEEQHINT